MSLTMVDKNSTEATRTGHFNQRLHIEKSEHTITVAKRRAVSPILHRSTSEEKGTNNVLIKKFNIQLPLSNGERYLKTIKSSDTAPLSGGSRTMVLPRYHYCSYLIHDNQLMLNNSKMPGAVTDPKGNVQNSLAAFGVR